MRKNTNISIGDESSSLMLNKILTEIFVYYFFYKICNFTKFDMKKYYNVWINCATCK